MNIHKLMAIGVKVYMILVPIIYLATFLVSFSQWKKKLGSEYDAMNVRTKISIIASTIFTSNFFNPKLRFYKKHHEKTKGLAEIFFRNFKYAVSPFLIFFILSWLIGLIIGFR